MSINLVTVRFEFGLPVPSGVYLEIRGLPELLPLKHDGTGWSLGLELAVGTYAYRFRLFETVIFTDCRRSTQRLYDGEMWSVVLVEASGAIWLPRSHPSLVRAELCRGVSDSRLPIMVLDDHLPVLPPVVLWLQLKHVFAESYVQLVLLRPDGQIAFAGELTVRPEGDDYSGTLWLTIEVPPVDYLPGVWNFLIRTEGGPCVTKEVLFGPLEETEKDEVAALKG